MDPALLMAVLAQGEEQARQLKAQLDAPPVDAERCRSLSRQVQSSFETAVTMAKHLGFGGGAVLTGNAGSDSGWSDSPRSENSDGGLKDHELKETMCKKRKSMPKWSSQVRVSSSGGIEGSLDDGFSWRKYGQKDILGAKFPRGYYRCTHRTLQGCLATKQVQRSDGDPAIFDVSYRGVHTCVEKPHKPQASSKRAHHNPPDADRHLEQLLLPTSLRANLSVKTEGLQQAYAASSSSFSFASTPVQDNQFAGGFSHAFMSATAWPNAHSSESELTGIISAAASATSSPMVDIDFSQFDPNFTFDGSSFF